METISNAFREKSAGCILSCDLGGENLYSQERMKGNRVYPKAYINLIPKVIPLRLIFRDGTQFSRGQCLPRALRESFRGG
jgi:hypothetical protein